MARREWIAQSYGAWACMAERKLQLLCLSFFFNLNFFLLIDFRERKKTHWFIIPRVDAFIGWFLYVPCPGTEPTTLACWDDILTNWATWPGHQRSEVEADLGLMWWELLFLVYALRLSVSICSLKLIFILSWNVGWKRPEEDVCIGICL